MATNSSLFRKAFWLATFQRCIRVFAAALFAVFSADTFNILHVDWASTFATAALAPILTLLFCVAGDALTGGAGPAFGTIEVTSPPAPAVQGSVLKGEAGATGILYAVGVGLLLLAVLLLVLTLLKAVAVSWVALVVLAVIGVVLILVSGRSTRL